MKQRPSMTIPKDLIVPDGHHFQLDCEGCQGLCCMSLRIDTDNGALFKREGAVCQNLNLQKGLDDRYKCSVYENRDRLGLTVCGKYDCYGAGQEFSSFLRSIGIELAELKEIKEGQINRKIENLMNAFRLIQHHVYRTLVRQAYAGMSPHDLSENKIRLEVVSNLLCAQLVENLDHPDYELDIAYWRNVFKAATFESEKVVRLNVL